jgi:hypothetical protein
MRPEAKEYRTASGPIRRERIASPRENVTDAIEASTIEVN